jgi:hypothetical protein
MAFAHGNQALTKENILVKIDSYQLFKVYCPQFKELGKMFSSEFRPDPKPSCHIIVWKGDLLYKDFGEEGYRIFDYIARKFDTDYYGALRRVNEDFNLGLGGNVTSSTSSSLVIPEKASEDLYTREYRPTIIQIKKRDWTKLDVKYWSEYEIPLKLLEYHNTKSISHYRIDSARKENAFYAVNPYMLGYSFDYYWSNGVFRRKLYFPQLDKGRFISNVDDTIVQGWTLLPKYGKVLFITKSYKDILIFNLLGYWAIAPNSELTYIPDAVMDKLKQRFENIYCWFDNDEGGIKGAKQFTERFDLEMIHNPLGEPKDPSDYVKKYRLKTFDTLVSKFLKHGNR